MEFASFYNTLGADTTIIEVLDQILPVEDPEISSFAKKQFEKQGIKIFDKSKAVGLKSEKDGFSVEINTSGEINLITCDTIISAVGIVGNTEGLGLDALKVEVKDNHVVVDEFCKTNIGGIFAIGDLAGAPWLAHKASHEGVMVAEIIAGKSPNPINYGDIAGCTYCYPQIASVGITEEKAKKNGREIKMKLEDYDMIIRNSPGTEYGALSDLYSFQYHPDIIKKAVALQDDLPYTEPPFWYYPTRQSLGRVLIEAGKLEEAEAVFKKDLEDYPRTVSYTHLTLPTKRIV